jgi:hypothetical protein
LEKEASELHDLAEKGFADYSWLNFFSSGWRIRHEAAKLFVDSERLEKASAHMIATATAAAVKR